MKERTFRGLEKAQITQSLQSMKMVAGGISEKGGEDV